MKGLDQFYTNGDIVDMCLSTIDPSVYDMVIEPSAGSGSFYYKIKHKNKIAFDLDPKFAECIKMDCLDYMPDCLITTHLNRLTSGNPPFGKNSSLAVKIFNHFAIMSKTIAFILPRTFRKPAIINRLHKNFHLVIEIILPKNSFHIIDYDLPKCVKNYNKKYKKLYDVPCVWQVWEKTDKEREKIIVKKEHKDFEFVKRKDADFLIQRVGGGAGNVSKDMNKKEPAYYNIKASDEVCKVFERIDWNKSAKYDTAGNPSLSKGDIIEMYDRFL